MKILSLRSAVLALVLGVGTMNASVIYTSASGTGVTASILTDFSTFAFYDVRGVDAGLVGATPVFLEDSTLGTDPGFATLPFGNLSLSGFTSDLANIVALTFDGATASVNGSTLTLGLTGTFLANGNGSLTTLTGPLVADFAFLSTSDLGGGTSLVQYGLTTLSNSAVVGAVPEPSTVALVGLALPLVAVLRRRKRVV